MTDPHDDLADELAAFLGTFPSLERVIPIARTVRSPADLPLLIESVTLFSTGGSIRYCLVGLDMASGLPWDQIRWTATDDIGTAYTVQGGGGGGGETIMVMHADFEPPPPPSATVLHLAIGSEVVDVDLRGGVAAT